MAKPQAPLWGLLIETDPLSYEDTVSVASTRMRELQLPVLPVVDHGRYVGIVSAFSLLRSRLSSQSKVGKIALKTPVIDNFSDPVGAAKAMLRSGVPGLAASVNGEVVGVVTARSVLENLEFRARVSARELMTRILGPVHTREKIDKARKVIVRTGSDFIPVVSDKGFRGVVSVYDILSFVYGTPLRRSRLGEVRGDVSYFLDQPVGKIVAEEYRAVALDSTPSREDVIEGAVVLNRENWPVGVITPYSVLRRVLFAIEEANLPLRVEGLDGLDMFSQGLIYKKSMDVVRTAAKRGRLLEASVVLKPRFKTGERERYDAYVTLKFDKGVHSGRASAWDPVEAVEDALDMAYESFAKLKDKKRTKRLTSARKRKLLWG